jgi:autotransporter-associated beta strand protein
MNLCRRTIAPCSCHGIVVFALIACLSGLFDRPLRAATFYWDTDTSTAGNNADGTGLGGTGTWDTATTNWWDTTNLVLWPNTNVDAAVFSGPFSILPTLNTVTLISGVTANQLRFERSGYTLTGGDLTLAGTTPTLHVNMGETATISSQISGTAGLTKTGGGSIRLGNAANDYTGTTTISNGTVIIDNNGALGTDSSTVIVAGTTGGGSLLLAGGYGSGFTLTRDVSISGGSGAGGTVQSVNGGALVSVGDNTITGQLTTFTAPNSTYTGMTSAFGMLTLGNVATGGTAVTNFTTFGSNGSIGSYAITGVLSGTGGIQKTGGGTLLLTPSSSSGFAGTLRIVLGSVRISSGAVLGIHTGTTTSSTVELNGGTLEVRSDAAATAIGKNVYMSNGSALFVDHEVGGSAINGTVTFGAFSFLDNENLAINGRNGYNVTLGAAQITSTVDGPTTFTNSLSGLLTIGGNLWNYTEGDAARAFTMAGAGNTLVTGNILASGNTHSLVKTGAGTLTLTGTASTYTGATSVNGGTLAINDFRAITNNTATINIGANGTGLAAGILAIIGNNMTLANLTTSKVVNLGGTTNGATILANQTGTSPGVVFNAAFTATGAGIKTLTLGGANIGANTINGAIVQNGTTNVTKIDAGRWILAGTNTYTGATTISNGTLQLKANAASSTILADTSAIVFDATNVYAGGILELIGQASTNNVETLGALTPTNGSGTVRLTPGSGGTASIVFASLGTVGGGGTVNIVAPTSSDTVSFTSITGITAGNIANAGVYYNGSDFAFVPGAGLALRAPDYTTDTDFATTSTALTAASSMEITGAGFSNAAVTIDSLRINGATALNMTGLLTIRTAGTANASGGIIQTGGSGSITGTGVSTGGSGALVINVDGGANSLSLDAPITSTTTGGFTKVGAGTLRLGGTNAQTGTISINEGTVRLAGADRLGAAAALTIRQDGILELNGVTPATNTNAFNNNGIVRNTSATTDVVFTVGGANGTGTSLGIIEDGGVGKISVVKIGTGAQSWLGLSTYTGATTIGSTGIVTINNLADGGFASGIGASSNAAGNLILNGASATQAYGGLSYTGTSTISIDRLFTFGGTAANSGARIQANGVNNAAVIWNNTSALAFGTVDIAQGLVLGGASLGDNRFNPLIADNGTGKVSLFKADAGLWILGNSANSYTGATTITNGFLSAQDGTTLPNASGLILGGTTTGGVLETSGDFTRSIVASGSAGANTVSWNSTLTTGANGFSASSSKLRVAFGGIGAETALTWGGGGFGIGTGALIFNSTTALSEVEFRNAIDLNGATRTFQVNDNTSTFTDFATISGVVSGTGGISKTGAGLLQLVGANTYSGTTAVTAGTLVVTSLGNSTSPASTATSVGVSGAGTIFDNTNAITLGAGGNNAGILQYVGTGEVSDRIIRLNSSTGTSSSNQISANGSGALILTNVLNDMTAGAKTLFLRGANNFGNTITSVLADNGGALGITHDSAGTWILTGNNIYTGTTTASGGALGAGSDTAFGAGSLSINNATIFAYGADRTLSLAVSEANSTGAVATFAGDYSLTFNGAWTNGTTSASGRFLRNNIISGKTLTINGDYTFNGVTTGTNMNFDGSGDTIINGIISNTLATMGITYVGTGSLTLGGANTYNGATNVSNGVLKLGASEVIPDGTGKGNVAINPAVGVTATLDLNGKSETINGLTANGAGTAIIDNTSGTAASLTFGANDQAVNIGGLGNYTITDSGAGALSITKTGTGSASILTGVVLTYQGSTNVNGGSMTVASAVNGTTGISVTNSGSALALTGGITTPGAITSVVVENGGTLSLLDGAGSKLSGLTTLTLGSTGGAFTDLNFNVGDVSVSGDELNTDTLILTTGGALNLFAGNQIRLNLNDAGLNGSQTYELLNFVDGGFTTGVLANTDYVLGATPGGFTSLTLTATDTSVFITTGTLITGSSYWRGLTDTTWNANVNNWSQDKAGAVAALSTPGQGTDVIFQWDAPTNAAVVTTLEQNFKINSLTFADATVVANTASSVTIDPGLLTPTARLEIAPQSATDGIKLLTTNATSAIISGAVKLGGDATSQTWEVTNAGSVLSIGALFGEKDVTKTGLGKVTLTAASDPTFNGGVTSDFTINAGTLEILDSAALGNTINANLATVTVNNTGAFFYNGVTGTVANNLTLNGGSLSVGTATQTYSGTVNVSGNSFINLRDSNSAVTTTVSRSIVLTGVISGSGRLTISSDETVANLVGGNAELGTLTINNLANTWDGELAFQSGSVDFTSTPTSAANAGHTGAVTFNQFGRLIYRNINGQTLNRTGALTFAAGAIGEIYVDNISAVLGADYVINQNGVTTLGSGGTGASARFTIADAASTLNIAGGVVLGGNSSISVDGGDADSYTTISGIISDGGSGYSLAINDDAGGWGISNNNIRLTGASTFTGNVILASGVLEYDTVTGISGAASSLGQGTAIDVSGSATLSFIGTSAQSTDRPINLSAGVLTLSANGTGVGTSVTYAGAITIGNTADGSNIVLTGTAGSEGVIAGGITETADTADMTVNGGTWTHQTGTSRVGDGLTITGADTILNLNSGLFQVRNDVFVVTNSNLYLNGTGVLSFNTATLSADASLRAYAGGTITLGADDAVVATQFDGLRIGVDGTGTGTLNMGTFNQTVTEFILGNRNIDRTGIVNGTGILTVTGNLDLYAGTIHANLASTGSTVFEKIGADTVTLRGNNSGLASTGATIVYDGILALDYTADNNTKLRAASALDLRGARLNVIGNNSAATTQTVGGLTLGSGGSSTIQVTGGTGQDAVLNLGTITRANLSQDGTIRFILPSGTQSATNGITTTSPNSTFGMLGTGATATSDAAYATVQDGTGTWFATASGGNIVALASTPKNDVTTWAIGDHITDETTGFTGTLQSAFINSLRFNTAGGSDVIMSNTGVLIIGSGGFLITNNVGGTPSMMGGTLASGATELVITQDSSQPFEIGSDIRINQGVTKTGAGTLLLSGNNVYTGVTEIQEGTLQVSGNSIGDTSVVTLSASRPTTLELLADETIGRLQGGSRNTDGDYGTVAVGSHTLTINHSGSNQTYAGFLTGDGTIIKQGTHNLGFNNISSGFTGILTVESGLVTLSGIGQINASTVRINKGGTLDFNNTGTTRSGTRILDTTAIALNSADGNFQGETIVRGLSLRTDQDGTLDETLGLVTLNTGASYVGMQATTANDDSDIIVTNLVRLNSSTLNIRGTNLGGSLAQENEFRIGDATNQTAFIANAANLVGGGGAAASQNISIVPWAVGESTTGALAATNMGNSLVTYVSGSGFRPLTSAEYNSFGTQVLATDNIRESLTGALAVASGPATTINALVLHNASVAVATHAVTGAGVGETLAITSGALLFTLNPAATANSDFGITLGGFDSGITVGGTNEYVISVVNPNTSAASPNLANGATTMGSATVTVTSTTGLLVGMTVVGAGIPDGALVVSVGTGTFNLSIPATATATGLSFASSTPSTLTATIESPLTSTADITKSGRGTLVLSGTNAAGGGVEQDHARRRHARNR